MKGFTMGMLNSKTKSFVMTAIGMGQDYYPEIMHQMFIINCPLMFRAAWQIFKPFIDEKTRKKIKILGTKYTTELFEAVDPANVPTFIGGECDTDFTTKGPWIDHAGDAIASAHKAEMDEIWKFEKDPDNYVEVVVNSGGEEEVKAAPDEEEKQEEWVGELQDKT